MRVLVTGATGMIGGKLVKRLLDEGRLAGRAISALELFDVVPPTQESAKGIAVFHKVGDLAAPGTAETLVARKPDIIFHLASVVSGEAETNLELGYRVNLDGSRMLFDAIRGLAYNPRVVFTSSGAVFGAPFPDLIPDNFHLTPMTSYGTQKLMVEALLSDYTRRGYLDGVSIRLPAICVRPGKPNKAASGFYSSIIREPLHGIEATVPISRSLLHTSASPRAAVGYLIHAAGLDSKDIGARRGLNMPGVCCTVGEQIDALARIAGDDVLRLIKDVPDPAIARIVETWPTGYEATRGRELGFEGEKDFDEIIRVYIEEEMPDFRRLPPHQ